MLHNLQVKDLNSFQWYLSVLTSYYNEGYNCKIKAIFLLLEFHSIQKPSIDKKVWTGINLNGTSSRNKIKFHLRIHVNKTYKHNISQYGRQVINFSLRYHENISILFWMPDTQVDQTYCLKS